jgi:hypothetical protein
MSNGGQPQKEKKKPLSEEEQKRILQEIELKKAQQELRKKRAEAKEAEEKALLAKIYNQQLMQAHPPGTPQTAPPVTAGPAQPQQTPPVTAPPAGGPPGQVQNPPTQAPPIASPPTPVQTAGGGGGPVVAAPAQAPQQQPVIPRVKVPAAIIGKAMPDDYTATQITATTRAFSEPLGGELIGDMVTKKPEEMGALNNLIKGIRNLQQKCLVLDSRGTQQISVMGQGATSSATREVTNADVASKLEAIVFNTDIEITAAERRMLGDMVFTRTGREAYEKMKKVDGKDLYSVNLADALDIALWAGESHQGEKATFNGKSLSDRINERIKVRLGENLFTYQGKGEKGEDKLMALDSVTDQMEGEGVKFNEYMIKVLGWMARDMSQRVHQKYLQITKREAHRRLWGRHAESIGVEDPATQAKARAVLSIYNAAHGETLEEFRDRPDLSTYEKNMVMTWHKGADDREIAKGAVLGASNPLWKIDECRHILEEFFLDFREHKTGRPDFRNESEWQRNIAQKLWDRLDNVIYRDARKPNPDPEGRDILNEGLLFRDGDVKDMQVNGIPGQQAAAYAYMFRVWGKDDESAIRGYGTRIGDAWGAREFDELTEKQTRNILAAVNDRRAAAGTAAAAWIGDVGAQDLSEDVVRASGYLTHVKGEDDEAKLRNAKALLTERIEDEIVRANLLQIANRGRRSAERLTHLDQIDMIGEDGRSSIVDIPQGEKGPAGVYVLDEVYRASRFQARTRARIEERLATIVRTGRVATGEAHDNTLNSQITRALTEIAKARGQTNLDAFAVGFLQDPNNVGELYGALRDQFTEDMYARTTRKQRPKDPAQMPEYQRGLDDFKAKFYGGIRTVDDVVEAVGRQELVDGLAKTRMNHDLRRGTYVYFETMFRKAHMHQSQDMDLRARTILKGDIADQTAVQMLKYELKAMARGETYLDEERGVSDEVRNYAHGFRDMPDVVSRLLTSTQWQKVATEDLEDPSKSAERNAGMQDVMFNITPQERTLLAGTTGDTQLNTAILYQTLRTLEKRFIKRHDDLLKLAIETSPERRELDNEAYRAPGEESQKFNFERTFVTEALKVSAPPGTPENQEDYYGRIRVSKLLGKYGDRLKALRDPLGNPYTPLGNGLVFNPAYAAEREPLLQEIANDLFGKGEFTKIGDAMKEKAFQDYCKKRGLDPVEAAAAGKKADWAFGRESMYDAARQTYVFLQSVHAKYRGAGEQYTDTNEYGATGQLPEQVDAGNLFDSIATPEEETGRIRVRVRQYSEAEAAGMLTGERGRGRYADTAVVRGLNVSGAWANEQRAIAVLAEDPYAREFMLNLGRVQQRYFDEGYDEAGSSKTWIRDNALLQTARTFGIRTDNLNLTEFNDYFKNYGNAVLAQSEGNTAAAIDYYSRAYTNAKQFSYDGPVEEGQRRVDLRVITLNARGWARKEVAEDTEAPLKEAARQAGKRKMARADRKTAKGAYQLALNDFTAAWKTSRGEGIGDQLDETLPTWEFKAGWPPVRLPKVMRWLRDRFGNASKAAVAGENAEAMAGMGVVNSRLSNVSSVSGEDSRGTYLGTALVSGLATAGLLTAGVATGGAALAVAAAVAAGVGGVSLGLVGFTERLRLGERWTSRAKDEAGAYSNDQLDNSEDSRDYIRAYERRTVAYAKAQAYTNSGDRSWWRFFRQNHATFGLDGNLKKYNTAVKELDVLTHNQIMHVFNVKSSERQDDREAIHMQELYNDSVDTRELKRRSLQSMGRYYEAANGSLDRESLNNEDMTDDQRPEAAKVYDLAQRNHDIQQGVFGSTLGVITLGILSKGVGETSSRVNLIRYMDDHQDEVKDPSLWAGFNHRAGILLNATGNRKKAIESWQQAMDKWREGFRSDDLSIIKSDALRELIELRSYSLNNMEKPPEREWRWLHA